MNSLEDYKRKNEKLSEEMLESTRPIVKQLEEEITKRNVATALWEKQERELSTTISKSILIKNWWWYCEYRVQTLTGTQSKKKNWKSNALFKKAQIINVREMNQKEIYMDQYIGFLVYIKIYLHSWKFCHVFKSAHSSSNGDYKWF